jgi:NADPH-dependent 2,4-dienoyl-CoA reductase/sulfur reductase-like enzyme
MVMFNSGALVASEIPGRAEKLWDLVVVGGGPALLAVAIAG